MPIDTYKVIKSFAERYCSILDKLVHWNIPVNHDKYIEDAIGDNKFIAYIDLMSVYQRILITHKNCEEFHFIEEGNSAYMAEDDLDDLTWEGVFRGISYRQKCFTKSFYQSLLRVIRGYNYRLMQVPYHYMAYVNFDELKFYCFSDNAFYNAPENKKVYVEPSSEDLMIQSLAKGLSLSNKIIWIDGSNGRFTGLDESYYHRAIKLAIDRLKTKYAVEHKVYVKLRLGIINKADNYLVSALMDAGFDVEILPGDINLECLFITSTNCKVVGVLTAALEYAHVFGHKSYTIYSLFEKQPPTYFDRMDGYWNNIKKL